jgi:hypothetical protein
MEMAARPPEFEDRCLRVVLPENRLESPGRQLIAQA